MQAGEEQVEVTDRGPVGDGNRGPSQVLWMAALSFLTVLFFGSFFNRFVGLRSGDGEFTTGMWFLHGHLPYLDYFSATPPLNTLKSALLLKIFGPYLLVGRIAGVAERVLIALVLFQWLRRLFPMRFAFTGALVTIILSAGDLVDPVASYNHDAILWAILSGYLASLALDAVGMRRLVVYSALAGLFAGLSLITKQTIGVGAAIGVPLVVLLLLLNGRAYRAAALWGAGFFAGVAVPVLLLALWLHRLHAWMTFLTMAFLKGPAAKGGHLSDFVRREVMVAGSNLFLVALALIAIALTARAILRSQSNPTPDSDGSLKNSGLMRLTASFAAVIASAELFSLMRLGALHNLSKAAVYFCFIVTALLLFGYGAVAVRVKLTPRQRQFALFAAVSYFVAFFLSLSWPAFEAMALPGLAFLIAAVLDGVRPGTRRYVYGMLAAMVFLQTIEKLDLPFGFDGLNEASASLATQPSSLTELSGIRASPDMIRFIEGGLRTVQTNSTPSDTIFTYPEMSFFYAVSGRGYPTQAGSHNVDVVNDAFAAEESKRILDKRPAVVIYMKLTPEEVAHQDQIWRFGKPSGQHILVDAVEKLVADYRVDGVYQVGQDSRIVTVYVRP